MTAKRNTADGIVEIPTATEFIPAGELTGPNRSGKSQIRGLQRVLNGKGLEVSYHEPYDDEVLNHVYVCDECGQSEDLETDMEFHLRTAHEINDCS